MFKFIIQLFMKMCVGYMESTSFFSCFCILFFIVAANCCKWLSMVYSILSHNYYTFCIVLPFYQRFRTFIVLPCLKMFKKQRIIVSISAGQFIYNMNHYIIKKKSKEKVKRCEKEVMLNGKTAIHCVKSRICVIIRCYYK